MYKKIFSVKILSGETYKIARVMDKHCGKNDINELHMWNYKTGLNK